MNEFLTDLAALSVGGAAAIALAALVRRLTKTRYAARWRCWVWLVLCLRLLIPSSLLPSSGPQPISVHVPENVVIVGPMESRPIVTVPTREPPTAPIDIPDTEPAESEKTPPAPIQPPSPSIRLYDVLGILWMVGAGAVVLWAIRSHVRFLAYLRRWSKPVTEQALLNQYQQITSQMGLKTPPQLRYCAGLHAPMLAGIFHSTILLLETPMDSQSLRHTLLHELSHFRRKDIWLKTIALLACALHWFNPMLWYLNHMIAQDTELACDEAVLRFLPKEEHSAYCRTIFNSITRIHDKKGAKK